MKLNTLAATAILGFVSAFPLETRQQSGGSGPYGPAKTSTDSSLGSHTIYLPSNAGSTKLPVLVWGNGGCGADGTSNSALLLNIASYGYIAIADGSPGQQGSTTSQWMKDSINWISSKAGQGAYANVDASKIMAAGFSCGGVEAYDQIWDSRVSTIGIFSSGLLTNYTAANNFRKPILYALGGPSDIAYQNGERDFQSLPSDTPSWKGNLNVGHGGTLFDANGGLFGKAGLNWLQWIFRNDQSAKSYLQGGYSSDGWQVQTHALDKLVPQNKTIS